MITTKLEGGLGNQMFQYAAAKALATKLECPLQLDISAFNNRQIHNGFELAKFALSQSKNNIHIKTTNTPSRFESVGLSRLGKNKFVRFALRKINSAKLNHYVEKDFSFDENLFNLKPYTTIEGYWQSYRYFGNIRKQLLADFRFLEGLSKENQALAKKINSQNSVSLHVRRGDYVANAHTNSYHGVCGLDYYQKAISEIEKRVPEPVYFIFSDDPEWTMQNLKNVTSPTFVTHNTGPNSFFDMHLMSLCKHNIIANSSFSWWGAWLNENPEKVVIAPKQWFAVDKNTSDLLPPDWIRI